MKQQQLKGIVIKIQNKYIKFKKTSVIFDSGNNFVQGELLAPCKLLTASNHLLKFMGIVKLNADQKVIKGFLNKPQLILVNNKKQTIKGFVQFSAEGIINKKKALNQKIQKNFDQTLVSIIEDEIKTAETIEYFTLAHCQYITKPQQKIIKTLPRKNLNISLHKY